MEEKLSPEDIKTLRYQCRGGYVIAFFVWIFLSISVFLINAYLISESEQYILISGIGLSLVISALVLYAINRKYFNDLKNGIKTLEIKQVQFKEAKRDFEAGSGTMYIGQEMKEFYRYDLIVENTKYRIEQELFEQCNIADQVVFRYAPLSRYLLSIKLK